MIATPVHGTVAPGFEPVAREFRRNFAERGEEGAAVAVHWRGEPVVDLWGGVRDHESGAPFERDTLLAVFSTTKGLAAMPLAMLHSRGLLEYDAPVAAYWPEFAANGKERITVRQLLAHQAGLSAVDVSLGLDDLRDPDRLASILARQRPAWEPGTRQGYHPFTLGWYESELVRRIDPAHRTLGRFFAEEVAARLGIEFYIGLPPEVPDSRIARIHDFHPLGLVLQAGEVPWRFALAVALPWSLTRRTFRNPRYRRPSDLARRPYLDLELPASCGIGEVRAIARVYSVLAEGGAELGLGPETMRALEEPAPIPSGGNFDLVLQLRTLFSLGFGKPRDASTWGTSARAYGAFGAGGSFGFADPEARIGYGYAPTRMGYRIWDDPREHALRYAVYESLRNLG